MPVGSRKGLSYYNIAHREYHQTPVTCPCRSPTKTPPPTHLWSAFHSIPFHFPERRGKPARKSMRSFLHSGPLHLPNIWTKILSKDLTYPYESSSSCTKFSCWAVKNLVVAPLPCCASTTRAHPTALIPSCPIPRNFVLTMHLYV